jgi:hypothetical protein
MQPQRHPSRGCRSAHLSVQLRYLHPVCWWHNLPAAINELLRLRQNATTRMPCSVT